MASARRWAAFSGLLALLLGAAFVRSAAPTFDEPVHLASGAAALSGDYGVNAPDHPPFAEMWAALPARLLGAELPPERAHMGVYELGDRFLYGGGKPAGRILAAARLFCLFAWGGLIGLGLWRWAARLGGEPAAAAALLWAALCPVLISNISLATTDGASAALFFLTFALLSAPERTRRVWACAGACAGLAMASKYNMLLLPLLAALVLTARPQRERPKASGPLLAAGCAVLAWAAVYRFSPLPLYWRGLGATFHRLEEGRGSFLLGRRSVEGAWLYFPLAFAAKTPLAFFPLAALGAAALKGKERRRDLLWIFIPFAGYFAAAMTAKVQIGVRHLLPIYPFLALLAGLGFARLWARRGRARIAAAALALWAGVSVGLCAPDLLAYFNEAAGGPGNGWRVLADSNLDWGQGLKELAAYLRSIGNPPIYLCYFGVADPAYYGIRYAPVLPPPHVRRLPPPADPESSGRALLAISATNLQGVYFSDPSLFAWLKERRPLAVAGYSIFVYDLTDDPAARAWLRKLSQKA